MAATSPSPNSSPSATPPISIDPPPSQPSRPSPGPPTSPSSQPNASSPTTTPSTPSSPPQLPPPPNATSPPPSSPSPRPPQPSVASPPRPPPSQPISPSPPPPVNASPPATNSPPPLSTNPPPPSSSDPPGSSPPPLSSNPPSRSPPPPSSSPPPSSPPPSFSNPPASSPPPPLSNPPASSPPPPLSNPPASSPPPPSSNTPASSPPPPSSNTPASSPSPPSSDPPASSPPPPSSNPPASSRSPPSTNPPATSPPPPSTPPRISPLSPPPSSQTPSSSPPPPLFRPPESSPPPPRRSNPPERPPSPPPSSPPQSSPPLPASNPPEASPPPPASMPPNNTAPPPPIITPPSGSPPSSNSPPELAPPPPLVRLSPPPPSNVSPPSMTPPSPSQVPSDNPTTNNSSPNAPEQSNSSGNGGIGTGGAIAIGSIVGLLLLSLIGTVVWCMWKRKKKVSRFNGGYVLPTSLGSSPKSVSALLKVQISTSHTEGGSGCDFVHSPTEPGGLGNSRSWFTYEELFRATNGFSEQNLLGEGGFGSVYRGRLPDEREVAIKQLKIGGGQGEREFKAEVEIISRIHHRHLVSLVGYCISENQRMLIYEYVPNNTLHFHLHGQDRTVMDWATRVKIAVGAARGIAYLHEDCHPRIIHRDIKSSNILLDNNFEARVSDFGLAKLTLDANTHVTTRVMGTFGYVAPEYASSGKLTEKSDVYSFGVVLLELITGRKPVDASQPLGEESLVEWARPLLSHALDTEEFEGLVDPRLEKNYIDSEMFRMIEAAAACVRHSSAKRPRMGQVVRAFDGMVNWDLTNGMRVGESELFNSAQQSAEIRLFRRMAFGSQNYSTDFFSQSNWNSEELGEKHQKSRGFVQGK